MKASDPITAGQLDLNELVESFARETQLDRLKELAIVLSKPGATSKAASLPPFKERIIELIQEAIHDDGTNQLKALSLLGRLRQQARGAKGLSSDIQRSLQGNLERVTAPASALIDPLDRTYLAQMLRDVSFGNKEEYLAAFIASEPPVKTDARQTAITALLEGPQALSSTFRLLGGALRERRIETSDPHTSRARLLSRTLDALAQSLAVTDPTIDPSVGTSYAKCISVVLGPPSSIEAAAKVELGQAILAVLVSIIRPHFSLVRDPSTFEAVRVAYSLFSPGSWPRKTEKTRDALAQLLKEAITLLAQSGVTDNRLRETFVLITDKHVANSTFKDIASGTAGLSNDVIQWLETGKSVTRFDAEESVAENMLEAIDRDVARCYRDALALSVLKARAADDIVAAAPSELGELVKSLMQKIDQVIKDCELVALARGLQIRLHPGDVVEYSPVEHDMNGPSGGTRLVRILLPAVVRAQDGSTPRIVLKAIVTADH